jgi:hypothetical protein
MLHSEGTAGAATEIVLAHWPLLLRQWGLICGVINADMLLANDRLECADTRPRAVRCPHSASSLAQEAFHPPSAPRARIFVTDLSVFVRTQESRPGTLRGVRQFHGGNVRPLNSCSAQISARRTAG